MKKVMAENTNTEQLDHSDAALAKQAIVPSIINGAINGAIQWFVFRSHQQIQITGDSISSNDLAVFGEALQIALSLSFIGTTIAYLTFKTDKPKPPYFPNVVLLTLKHIFFVFGIGTSIAILWHRLFGTIMVSPLTGTLMTAVIAAFASWFITWRTMREIVEDQK